MLRKPCVAGRFYPSDKTRLKDTVEGYLVANFTKEKVVALMAPHAGYVFSGHVAGAVYSQALIPDNVVLIGPNHTGLGANAALMSLGAWETPLGDVAVNEDLAALVLDASRLFKSDPAAHLMEHSLEVQLPFIKIINKAATIVPITVMRAAIAECIELGGAIAKAIAGYAKETLIVISSDMNHYEPDKKTRMKDSIAIERVLALDAEGLYKVVEEKDISMCGAVPAVIALFAAKKLGAKKGRLVKYATSGERGGGMEQVVGYAGIIIN
ncbi:MAG: AmmeMemoRadiSam system protein B [Deltaproteobacteria bacterium]|nr:AmmeMemoRadiSam system protein B [Deltaproteobacteria bacterium]